MAQLVASNQEQLELLYKEASQCKNCPLGLSRTNPVLFRGNPEAKLMIIGEGPGYHEDQSGIPFVGPRWSTTR